LVSGVRSAKDTPDDGRKNYEISPLEATMPLSIRRGGPADAPVIVEFNRLLAQETEGKTLDLAILGPGVAAGLADPRKGVYFLAEEDGTPAGQIMFTTEWSDWRNGWFWWIQSVYVRREARRRGVFRALFEHVYQAARADAEVIGLRLYVERENHAALETYRRMGMEAVGYVMFERYPL
jgi:GNAT superfamily N-acetyltransferase